jgi:hypothetical protein
MNRLVSDERIKDQKKFEEEFTHYLQQISQKRRESEEHTLRASGCWDCNDELICRVTVKGYVNVEPSVEPSKIRSRKTTDIGGSQVPQVSR